MLLSIRNTFLFLFLLIGCFGKGQSKLDGIGYKHEYGYIIPHTNIIHSLVKGHFSTYHLYGEIYADSLKQNYFPGITLGYDFQYSDWANKDDFGNTFGISSYFRFPIFTNDKLNWALKSALGLGWIEKPFDKTNNYKNGAIGSKLNANILFSTDLRLKIYDALHLTTGLSFYHFSNGTFKMPNLGINVGNIHFGLFYQLNTSKTIKKSEVILHNKIISNLIYAFSIKEVYPVNGSKFFAQKLNYSIRKQTHLRSAFGIGLDFYLDPSKKQLYKNKYNEDLVASLFQAGIAGQYYLTIDDVIASVQMGVYFLNKISLPVYHKLVCQKMINESLFAQFSLKSHWAKADQFEFGIGYRW